MTTGTYFFFAVCIISSIVGFLLGKFINDSDKAARNLKKDDSYKLNEDSKEKAD